MVMDCEKGRRKLVEEVRTLRSKLARLEPVKFKAGQAEQTMISEALEHSKKDWIETFNAMSDWVVLLDPEGRIVRTNRIGEEFTGVSIDEILWQSCCKLVHGSDKHIPGCPMLKMLETGRRETAELKVPDEDQWLMVTVDPVTDKEGNLTGAVHIVRDITERKKAQQEIENLFNLSPDMICVCTPEGKFLKVSPSCEGILGYTVDEVRKLGWANLVHPDDAERTDKEVEKQLRGSPVTNFINRFRCKDGTYKTLEWQATPSAKGIVYATARDITERKKAEEELAREHNLLRTLVDTLPDEIFVKDTNSTFVFNNLGCARNLGAKTPEEMVGKTDFDFLPREFAEIWYTEEQEIIRTGRPMINREECVHDESGRPVKWCSNTKVPWRDDSGNIIGIIGLNRDITKTKKASEALRESEEKYRQLVSTTTDSIMLFDAATKQFVDVNKACEQLYGYSREEFLKLRHDEITAEAEESADSIKKVLNGELRTIPVRYHKKKDGTIFPVEISASVFELHGRKVLCGVVRDITERKRAEEERTKLFHDVYERVKELNCLYNISRLIEKSTSLDEILQGTVDIIPPSWQYPEITYSRLILDGEEFATENYSETKWKQSSDIIVDNEKHGTLEVGYLEERPEIYEGPFLKEERDLLKALAERLGRIVERKRAEEGMRLQSEIMKNMSEGVHLVRASDGIIAYTNPKFEQMFGYGPGEMVGQHVSIVNAPADEDPKETAKEIMMEKGFWKGEIRNIKKDGTPFWSYASVTMFDHPEQGKVLVSVHTDITERKRAEEEIAKLAKFPSENPNPVLRIAKDSTIIYANKASGGAKLDSVCLRTGARLFRMYSVPVQAQKLKLSMSAACFP